MKVLITGQAIFDDSHEAWNKIVDQIRLNEEKVIVLRGAGSVNGAEKSDADLLLEKQLIPRIEAILNSGKKVVIMYDGDDDNMDKPDIGYFMGRLLDRYGNGQNGVTFVAAQKRSWYYPKKENGNLGNAHGLYYLTYVFEDGVYLGDHSTFTQDQRLVEISGYEQWYIGACGDIATGQLIDLNKKVPAGQKRQAIIFRVRNNPGLDHEIENKLKVAESAHDPVKIAKFKKQLEQRLRIYGTYWDNEGKSTIGAESFPNQSLVLISEY